MKIILKSLISSILFIFIFSCSDEQSGIDLVEKNDKNVEIELQQLIEKHNTNILIDSLESFTSIEKNEILTNFVILDTTIKGIYTIDGETYIKTYITNKLSDRILTVLKCDKDTARIINNFKNNRAFISAKISKIKISDSIAEIKNIDGETKFIKIGYDIFLFGDLLEIKEIPTINYFNKNYWN